MKTKTTSTPKPPNVGRKRIEFRCQAPSPSEVAVAGSFNGWEAQPLKPSPAGYSRVMYLPPGCYEYKFLINGEWTPDPACQDMVRNDFGTLNSRLSLG